MAASSGEVRPGQLSGLGRWDQALVAWKATLVVRLDARLGEEPCRDEVATDGQGRVAFVELWQLVGP